MGGRPSIFRALKARRCYALTGGRIGIDFRISDRLMGEAFSLPASEDRSIYFRVEGDTPVRQGTLVKNNLDIVRVDGAPGQKTVCDHLYDYHAERPTDYYYLRVTLYDGRMAWTSPIWIETIP